MRMHVSADIPLSEPNADQGLITWFSIAIVDDIEREDGDASAKPIGHARAARVHIGHTLDTCESICDALDADSGEMEALYGVFFDEEWLKDEFADGSGSDLLYVSEIVIEPEHRGRNIDFAVVRRLCDTLGQGAALAVVPYSSKAEIAHWSRLGFELSTPGDDEGYLHLCLGNRTARVDDPDRSGHFKVLPNPSPEEAHLQN